MFNVTYVVSLDTKNYIKLKNTIIYRVFLLEYFFSEKYKNGEKKKQKIHGFFLE